MINRFKWFAWTVTALTLLLASCSSSTSSSTGRGQIPTGVYSGDMRGQTDIGGPVTIAARLSLSVPFTTDDMGNQTIDNDSISGNFSISGGNRCFRGGPIDSGSLFGNSLNLVIADATGVELNLSGRTTDDTYQGTFSAEDSNCGPVTGNFYFERG